VVAKQRYRRMSLLTPVLQILNVMKRHSSKRSDGPPLQKFNAKPPHDASDKSFQSNHRVARGCCTFWQN
jgi:hypothetical protein